MGQHFTPETTFPTVRAILCADVSQLGRACLSECVSVRT